MADTQLPRGNVLNACYSIDKVLGRGGFGITYLATDTKLNLPVAVKEYLPEPFAQRVEDYQVEPFDSKQYEFDWGLDRFLSEAQILAQFKHPNIVRVNAAFEQYGTAYMVMEYEQGVSLAEYIRQDGSDLSQAFFEKFVLSIMGGLQGIHDKGFIHRDIKPANLMVRADYENTPVLIDFGSARSTAGSETGKLTAVTSAGYSPVEQHNTDLGEQGPWTDIYALAASIREGLTGEVPRASLDREFAVRGGPEKDPLRPLTQIFQDRGFSHEFLNAIDTGLSIMPDDRPRSLSDWRRIFEGETLAPVTATAATAVTEIPGRSAAGVGEESARPNEQTAVATAGQQETALPGRVEAATVATPRDLNTGGARETAAAVQEGGSGGGNKLPLVAGLAAVVLGGAGFLFTQMGGDDPVENAVPPTAEAPKAEEPKAEEPKVEEPNAEAPVTAQSDIQEPNTDASAPAPVATVEPVVVEPAPLPRPDAPIALISPVDRLKREVVALNAAADPFVQLVQDVGTVPDAAAEPIEMLFIKYKSLSESSIVRAFPDLKQEVANGLDRLSVANGNAEQVKLTLQNSVGADTQSVDESLLGWETLAGEQRSELIYSLASMSDQQRASLTRQTELNALIDQVNGSIKSKLEAGEFQSAARIVEVALLFGNGNETLQRYKALLELGQ